MRRTVLWVFATVLLAACSQDTTAPSWDELFAFTANDFGALAYGMPGGISGRGLPELGRLKNLPEALKLSAGQEAAIDALLEQFQAAHQADLAALAAIMDEARAARQAGKSATEVRAILARARPIHEQLAAAHVELRQQIDAVLTQAQKDWLVANAPQRCNPGTVAPLTDAQKGEIRALNEAFRAANAADLELVAQAMQEARAAHEAGKSREEVQAILDAARPAMERLQAAGDALRTAIAAVLTEEQRASACFRGMGAPHGPGRMQGGMQGGPMRGGRRP